MFSSRKTIRTIYVVSITLVAFVLVCSFGWYLLSHGYFDHGDFDVVHAEWFSSQKVALLVRRYDNEALGGIHDFVVVSDHLPTPAEFPHIYHSDQVVFSGPGDCLKIHWTGPQNLVIACSGPGRAIAADEIGAQRREYNGVTVTYDMIPNRQ